jgi:tetratricopeptide (TPR) repeat protein
VRPTMSWVRRRGLVRHLLLALGLCLAAACQAPFTSGTPRSAASGGDPRVLAADARLYRGDYDGAEAAYRSLGDQQVSGAAAHLSTLLAYEGRFQESVAQAQAGVTLRANSDSLARLTRALDWSEQIDAAVQAGARAVAAKPVTALAHVFYSEALADSGRFDAAERELRTAEDMGGDAYLQAEIDREWANFYRGRGDSDSELNYSELAVRAEPDFPERQLDLVRFDYANQRPQTARTLADRLLASHPRDYHALVGVADAAFVGGDSGRAPALYQAATAVRPGGSEAAVGRAEIGIVLNHDFNGAHDLLLNALKQEPTASAVYEFLRYLDVLVLGRDPAAELAPITSQRPGDLATARRAALDTLNGQRAAAGLAALPEDAALDEAAQAHAYYYLFNAGQAQVGGAGISAEDATLPAFTGVTALDRARHFGYGGAQVAEVATHFTSAGGTVRGSIDSVQRRFPLLDRGTVAVGYGEARVGSLTIAVLDVGTGPPATGGPVAYPPDGQSDVPASFLGGEIPDPLPQGAITPAGYPVSVQVSGTQQLGVTTGRLLGPDGKELPSYVLAPGKPLGANQWALVAKQPLKAGARYTAEVTGTVDGKDFTQRWSFTVAGP